MYGDREEALYYIGVLGFWGFGVLGFSLAEYIE